MRSIMVCTLLLVALAITASAQAAPPGVPAAQPPVLRAGDAVRIAVWQRQDLSGEFSISSEGRIAHPILKDAVIAGVPFDQAVARLGELLREFHGEAHFVAEPLVRVGVGGEVRQPNVYLAPPDMTLAYAVARAGGPTDRGRLDKVQLIRHGESRMVDLTDPSSEAMDVQLRSGDQILVSRRRDILREYVMPLSSIVGAVAALVRVTR